MNLGEYISKLNDEVFHFSPLKMINDSTFSTDDEMIEVYERDGEVFFLLDNMNVLRVQLIEFDELTTNFITKMYIRNIHKKLHILDVTDRYYDLLRKLTNNTLFYDNIIYILNKDLDAKLVYDQEGFASSTDNCFMLYSEDDVIYISYKSSDIYKFNSVDELNDLSKSVKYGMINYLQSRKERILNTYKELDNLENKFKNMLQ